jgi:hypothetical protein
VTPNGSETQECGFSIVSRVWAGVGGASFEIGATTAVIRVFTRDLTNHAAAASIKIRVAKACFRYTHVYVVVTHDEYHQLTTGVGTIAASSSSSSSSSSTSSASASATSPSPHLAHSALQPLLEKHLLQLACTPKVTLLSALNDSQTAALIHVVCEAVPANQRIDVRIFFVQVLWCLFCDE